MISSPHLNYEYLKAVSMPCMCVYMALHKFLIIKEEVISAEVSRYFPLMWIVDHAAPFFSWQLAKKQQDSNILQELYFSGYLKNK